MKGAYSIACLCKECSGPKYSAVSSQVATEPKLHAPYTKLARRASIEGVSVGESRLKLECRSLWGFVECELFGGPAGWPVTLCL